jgi:hypothetical protein
MFRACRLVAVTLKIFQRSRNKIYAKDKSNSSTSEKWEVWLAAHVASFFSCKQTNFKFDKILSKTRCCGSGIRWLFGPGIRDG